MKRSLFAASVLVSLAPAAFAQEPLGIDRGRNESVTDRARPEYDALGVRIGAFEMLPQVSLGVESDDNIFAQQTNEQSDTIFSVTPSLAVASDWSRHALRFYVSSTSNYHQDFDSEDVTNIFADGEFRLDVGRDGALGAGGGYTDASEPRTSPDSPVAATSPVDYRVGNLFAYGRYTFNRVRLTGRVDYKHLDYDDVFTALGARIEEDDRDHEETVETARIEYALNPSAALVFQAAGNQRDYRLTPPAVAFDRNSNGYELLAGANADITNLIRGELIVGYMNQDFDQPGVSISGLAVAARAQYFVTTLTTISVNARRDVEDTGVFPAVAKTVMKGGVRVDHELLRNVLLTANVDGGREEYEGVVRTDEYWNADAGATYLMNRHVAIGAHYYYTDYNSRGPGRGNDFTNNRFLLSLTLKL